MGIFTGSIQIVNPVKYLFRFATSSFSQINLYAHQNISSLNISLLLYRPYDGFGKMTAKKRKGGRG